MKKLHLIDNPNVKAEFARLIMVKVGFVYATDVVTFVRFPVDAVFGEVFGTSIIEDDEELYFKKSIWETSKLWKAHSIDRDGLTFTAWDDKGKKLGKITATAAPKKEPFPDLDKFLFEGPGSFGLGLNPFRLPVLAEVLGTDELILKCDVTKENAPYVITAPGKYATALACIGQMDSISPYVFPGSDDEGKILDMFSDMAAEGDDVSKDEVILLLRDKLADYEQTAKANDTIINGYIKISEDARERINNLEAQILEKDQTIEGLRADIEVYERMQNTKVDNSLKELLGMPTTQPVEDLFKGKKPATLEIQNLADLSARVLQLERSYDNINSNIDGLYERIGELQSSNDVLRSFQGE